MRILGCLSCRYGKSQQISKSIHYRMDFRGKTSTTSSEGLIGPRAVPGSGIMFMSMNICSINMHDVIRVRLQGKKFKDSPQISSFLPTPETGIYVFPRPIFPRQCSPWRTGSQYPVHSIEKISDVTSRSSVTRRAFCRQYGLNPEPELFGNVVATHSSNVPR